MPDIADTVSVSMEITMAMRISLPLPACEDMMLGRTLSVVE